MDVRDLQERRPPATVATCKDLAALGEALTIMEAGGAGAIVVRNGGSPRHADFARFVAALIDGASKAQRRTNAARRG
jgi:hypothetical protein